MIDTHKQNFFSNTHLVSLCMCVCKYISLCSSVYVCFVFALVQKNGIVRAPEVKPLINQSINQSSLLV